jgi:hypothetical protein
VLNRQASFGSWHLGAHATLPPRDLFSRKSEILLRILKDMLSFAPYGHPKKERFFTPSAGSRY